MHVSLGSHVAACVVYCWFWSKASVFRWNWCRALAWCLRKHAHYRSRAHAWWWSKGALSVFTFMKFFFNINDFFYHIPIQTVQNSRRLEDSSVTLSIRNMHNSSCAKESKLTNPSLPRNQETWLANSKFDARPVEHTRDQHLISGLSNTLSPTLG